MCYDTLYDRFGLQRSVLDEMPRILVIRGFLLHDVLQVKLQEILHMVLLEEFSYKILCKTCKMHAGNGGKI